MVFNAVTADVKLLRDSVDAVAQLIDDGLFKLGPSGIELTAADRAMVAVVELKLNSSAFESYQCDREATIGLNLLNFLTVLRRAGPEDKLTLNLNESVNRLELTLTGSSVRSFAIPLLEMSAADIPPIGQLEFPAAAELKTDIITQGIEDADIIADSVVIELTDSAIRMTAEGDSSKAELRLASGSPALLKLAAREAVRSRYPLNYLKKIAKAARIADTARLQLGQDYPLRLEFKGETASIAMVLAPRVSEE